MKYQKFTPSGCCYVGIIKYKLVAKTQLSVSNSNFLNHVYLYTMYIIQYLLKKVNILIGRLNIKYAKNFSYQINIMKSILCLDIARVPLISWEHSSWTFNNLQIRNINKSIWKKMAPLSFFCVHQKKKFYDLQNLFIFY